MRAPTPPGPTGDPLRTARRFRDDPLGFFAALESTYPTVAAVRFGGDPVYVVSAPAAVGRILQGTGDEFAKLPSTAGPLDDLLGSGLLLSDGEQWARHRAIVERHFGRETVDAYLPRMVELTAAHVEDWTDGNRVDVSRAASSLTLAVLAETMFGVALSEATVRRLGDALLPVGRRFEPNPMRSFLPQWVPLPGDRAFDRSVDALTSIVDGIVAERRRTRGDDRRRLLDDLLDAYDGGTITRDELTGEIVTFLLAGHDTTALTIAFAWYLLATHEAVDERLADSVAALDDPLDATSLSKLPLLNHVIDETLRLYPAAWLLIRRATADTTLGAYRVPADAPLMLSPWAIQRSDRWYDDPDAFDPDRWADPADRPSFAYFPFGGGRRTCIGKWFALTEARAVLATVARRYRLADPPTSVPLRPTLTLHPREPIELTVRRRA